MTYPRAVRHWAEFRIYLHQRGATDRLLSKALPTLLQKADERWWFVRYWHGGPHVRLRVPAELADFAFHARLADAARGLAGGTRLDRDDFYAHCGFDGQPVNVGDLPWYEDGTLLACRYEAEAAYYGTGDTLDRHEALFCAASALASCLIKAVGGERSRLLVGADLMMGLFERARDIGQSDATGAAYARFLRPFGVAADHWCLPVGKPGAPGQRWRALLAADWGPFYEPDLPRSAWLSVLQTHLLLNRIGCSPRQETLLLQHIAQPVLGRVA